MKMKELWLPPPMLDLEGNSFVRIENYNGIIEFTDHCLILKANQMRYELQGEKLRIKGVTKREIFVEGEIVGLRIVKEEV